MELIRGTTPTLQFTFETIQATDITVAFLVVSQMGQTKIQKGIETATVDDSTMSFKLTQAETLSLVENRPALVTLDWLTGDGTRGRSVETVFSVDNSGVNEVI